MSVYVETPIHTARYARAFRLNNGAWEITTQIAHETHGARARWYGFTATPPRDVLAQAYSDMIGHDPFEDCPDISPNMVSDILQACARDIGRNA